MNFFENALSLAKNAYDAGVGVRVSPKHVCPMIEGGGGDRSGSNDSRTHWR
jgi:hypothetical protein